MTLRAHASVTALVDCLEPAIPDLMAQVHVPGLSIALVDDATVVWSRGFGLKKAGTAESVDTDTIFQAASLSKPLFAYAVLEMVERGELALDTPLTAYLPAPCVAGDPLLDMITARRVLCHMTGWPNWRPDGQPLVRDRVPGRRFGYSGEGYLYLQRVVERLFGRPLDAYMKETVLDPLNMAHSSYAWATPGDPVVATGHDRAGKPSDPFTAAEPESASSLYTTPGDFARFLCAMMITDDEPRRPRPESIAEMLRPQIRLNRAVSWGLGWGLEETGVGRACWHWGDNPGYKSFALAFPDMRAGLVVMTNGDGGVALWEPIVRLALGDSGHPAFAWLASWYGVPTLADAPEYQSLDIATIERRPHARGRAMTSTANSSFSLTGAAAARDMAYLGRDRNRGSLPDRK